MRSLRSQLSFFKIFLSGITILVLWVIGPQPLFAQSNLANSPHEAPVVLDGHVLFRVRNFESFSAQDRAQPVNNSLAESLRRPEIVSNVTLNPEGSELVLRLRPQNGSQKPEESQYLLTITQADLLPGVSAQSQARDWQHRINRALIQSRKERTPDYLQTELGRCLGLGFIALVIHLGVKVGRDRWQRAMKRASIQKNAKSGENRRFLSVILFALQIGLWIGVGYWVTQRFPILRQWRFILINNIATQPLFTINQRSYSTLNVLLLIALVLGMWFGVRSFTMLVQSRVLNVFGVQRGLQEAIAILAQYCLSFIGLILILQILGIDISSILFLGGALGVGIGFGLQNIVNNFISGIILLIERPIEVGNFVNVGDLNGTIERIGARSTQIRTLDQVTIIIPNAQFLEKEVVNWDYGNSVSRIHLPVGVAYGSDIAQVQASLLEAVSDHPDVLAYPRPQVWMLGLGESSLDFDVLVWLVTPREQLRIKSELYYQIEASLRRYGIEIPFPQRDLHVRSPHIDPLLQRLLHQYPSDQPQLVYPNNPIKLPHQTAPPQDQARTKSNTPPQQSPLYNLDIEQLVAAMRGADGIDIKDRRHRLNIYPKCFVGREAVEWLMQHQRATRESAVRIGQLLIDQGIIHHVLDEHPFQNANLYYRFYQDEALDLV